MFIYLVLFEVLNQQFWSTFELPVYLLLLENRYRATIEIINMLPCTYFLRVNKQASHMMVYL